MNIGLILAGGIGKGAYQVGALKALQRVFPLDNFKYIGASSIGALNAYSFMSRQIEELENIWLSINHASDSVFFSQLLKGSFLPEAIENVALSPVICDKFYLPLVTIKIRERKLIYVDICKEESAEERAKLLRASVAVPIFSKPVEINGENYYDGAVIDNVPSSTLTEYNNDIDFYVAIYFDGTISVFEDEALEAKTLKICFDDNTRFKNATFLTKELICQMMTEGKSRAEEILAFVTDKPDCSAEYIRSRIAEANTKYAPPKAKKLTSSRALTTLNKFAKRLITKKKTDDS